VSESLRMWMEVSFNSAYLVTIWVLVAFMLVRRRLVSAQNRPLANSFTLAFGLLALGDTGHVGFRIAGYLMGDLETTFRLAGMELTWVGLGALSTAITVTLFYVVMLFIWKQRFDQRFGWFGNTLLLSAAVRFGLMTLPGNAWNSVLPPQPWSLIRNIPLMVLGLGVAYLILRDARSTGDRVFRWIGWMILVSYGFYLPVILWVQQVPWIGMLMIPKTLAYVAVAIIAYRASTFKAQESPAQIRIG
jgi:hypothetical protein